MPFKPLESGEGQGAPGRGAVLISESRFRHRATWLTAMLCLEVLLAAVFQTPFLRFDRFAFMDSGGELAIQDLMRRGYRPALDFGYLYGLLPLLLGRLWYGLAGPLAAIVSRADAGLHDALGLGPGPIRRCPPPESGRGRPHHAGHPGSLAGLLYNACSNPGAGSPDQRPGGAGKGPPQTSLALLTACCFVKPSLAFVQGLAVVIAIGAANGRGIRAASVRSFGPALVTAAVLALILTLGFGAEPLAKTIFPFTGMAVYRISNYGFFHGVGREFWVLPHAGIRDYLRYEVGFWMLGTLVLLWGGLAGLRRLARGDSTGDRALRDEIIATCAAVHLGFVVLLFGHRGTWLYSLPMLILGLATLAAGGPRPRSALWLLVVLLLVSDRSKAVEIVRRWKTESPSAVTLNLWADAAERDEWARVLELTRGKRPALLAMCDGGALLTPGFAPPEVGYLVPGNALPAEVRRKAAQLASALMIISALAPDWPGFTFWPEITAAFNGCELVMQGRFVRVYRRVGIAPRATPPPEHATISIRPDRLSDLDRRGALDLAPDEDRAAGISLNIQAQRIGARVRVAVLVDQQIRDPKAIDEPINGFGVRRVGSNRQSACLPEYFARMAGQHRAGARGVLGDPRAGGVEVGVSLALGLSTVGRDGIGGVGDRGGQNDSRCPESRLSQPRASHARAMPSVAPTSRNGTIGIRNRPASVNGQINSNESVVRCRQSGQAPAGVLKVLTQPQMIVPDAAAAQRVASTAIITERRNTVPTSTRGPWI